MNVAAYRPTDNTNSANEPGFRGGLIQEYEEGDVRHDVNFGRGQSGDLSQPPVDQSLLTIDLLSGFLRFGS
ncbi:hypothetical protein GCM10023187_24020 [Nibrella viscosa]|uniref:Uncharacterized protein n=1 Tax=Nibrella viscosa TaxID=1084524 RepID=A0ABP8KET2_9BACT